MPRAQRSQNRAISSRRLEAFTDGVFAIASTLLVLDLSIDKLGPNIANNPDLWSALGGMAPEFLSFGISFLVLGALWSVHTWQFEYVSRVTQPLATLNTVRLLGVVLIPFTTSLNSSYTDLLAGRLLLPLNFLFVTIIGAVQWFYATNPARHLTEGLTETETRFARRRSIATCLSAAIVVVLAPFVGSWAFLAFLLNFAAERFMRVPSVHSESPGSGASS